MIRVRFITHGALPFLIACGDPSVCDYPQTFATLPNVLEDGDTCGAFTAMIGDAVVVDMHVTAELPECLVALGEGFEQPNDAIYTNLNGDGPKYTFDIDAVSESASSTIDITCDEGTEWHALFEVVPAP